MNRIDEIGLLRKLAFLACMINVTTAMAAMASATSDDACPDLSGTYRLKTDGCIFHETDFMEKTTDHQSKSWIALDQGNVVPITDQESITLKQNGCDSIEFTFRNTDYAGHNKVQVSTLHIGDKTADIKYHWTSDGIKATRWTRGRIDTPFPIRVIGRSQYSLRLNSEKTELIYVEKSKAAGIAIIVPNVMRSSNRCALVRE